MAVTRTNSTAVQSTNGTVYTFGYNAGTGSNRILMVTTVASSAQTSSITYAGASLSTITSGVGVAWMKKLPASGTNNIVVNKSTYSRNVLVASSWSGVDQVNPLGTRVFNASTGSSVTTSSITCPPGGAIMSILETAYQTGPLTVVNGTTLSLGSVHDDFHIGRDLAGGYKYQTGSLTFTIGTSVSWWSDSWPINAVGGFPTAIPQGRNFISIHASVW